ncbi:3727_t:CDS:2 [Ambispora leptoticha]|uniref:3727_t:CDS:1 n=1 Tax=Ambispora leptoticha TaxID=144679 RepID=A0A9N9CPM6_9GLOM|nr:3727_t:CDS:2 [Ambispora leptoticha]
MAIPLVTTHVFRQHTDEVWYVAISHNGKHLASASKDKTAIIWSLETWELLHVLSEHANFVSFVSWSPNDSMLLTCGQDNEVKLWNVQRVYGFQMAKALYQGGQDKNTFLWSHGRSRCSPNDSGYIKTYKFLGTILYKWHGPRIVDLDKEGTRMVAISTEKKIHIYDLVSKIEETILEEDAHSHRYTYRMTEIHLWDIDQKLLVRKYHGQTQSKYVIRSCFGGIGQGLIVSGSEDSNIYVWHREHAALIEVLSGHNDIVNSVHWSPVNPYLFASAGDDHTIRIWEATDATETKETP